MNQKTVPLSLIDRDPAQPRLDFDSEDARTAAAALEYAIRESGILQPILVRDHPEIPGRYMVVDGERRFRAATAIGLTEVPVYIREFQEDGRIAAQLFANLARRGLSQEEITATIIRLKNLGYKGVEIAEKLGKTQGWVSKQERFALDELAIKLREMGLIRSAGTYAEFRTLPETARQDLIKQHVEAKTPISRTSIATALTNLKNFDIDGVLSGLKNTTGRAEKRIENAEQFSFGTDAPDFRPSPINSTKAYEDHVADFPNLRGKLYSVPRTKLLRFILDHPAVTELTVRFPDEFTEDEIAQIIGV